MRPPSVGILWALTATVGCAQTGTATRPAYDVASIRPNTTAGGDSSSRGTTGQIVFTNQPLKRLIERAYGVKPFQVAGPPWIENVRFDITARYPPETNIDDRALMLRALLEDRFGLAVHRESKLMPGYTLVVSKSGFKLKPVEPGGGTDSSSSGGPVQTLTAKRISMAFLADFVARTLGEMVVDKTEIKGVYDLELRWARADVNPGDSDAPALFTALQETLGLRLQPGKVPVDVFVVDHVERVPAGN